MFAAAGSLTLVCPRNQHSLAVPHFTRCPAGYNATTDPAIDTFFSVVAYRYGHATINDVVLRLDDAWTEHHNGHLNLADTFYNPTVALSAGLEPLLRGMIAQTKGKVEPRWSLAMAGNFAGHAGINGEKALQVIPHMCRLPVLVQHMQVCADMSQRDINSYTSL